ncbi:MAG: TrmO family methyltransferase [Ignavibacteria bacterium]|nr:TrmO family methyltransferase [Ignavibacteria bacterium]
MQSEEIIITPIGYVRSEQVYRYETPRQGVSEKIGVFATRAPYRPNQIGMGCVKVERLKIFISESDILNGSSVIDI